MRAPADGPVAPAACWQEAQLLRRARALPDQAGGRPPGGGGPPADVMEALRKAAAGLGAAGAFQQGERERARAGVFRPSHALPTVTLAQQVGCRVLGFESWMGFGYNPKF